MIKIVFNKKDLIKRLNELESDFEQAKISKKDYTQERNEIAQQLETLEVADRVKRLQGKRGAEMPLDHWSEKEDEKRIVQEEQEKEELLKKYITKRESLESKGIISKERFGTRTKVFLTVFVVLAFVVGTSLGMMFITKPVDTSQLSMTVNASAFLPANNTTNVTQNVTKKITTNTTKTKTTTKNQSTPTPTPKPTPSPNSTK